MEAGDSEGVELFGVGVSGSEVDHQRGVEKVG